MKRQNIPPIVAVLAALSAFLYSLFYIIAGKTNSQIAILFIPLFMFLSGILSIKIYIYLFQIYKNRYPNLALYTFVLGVISAAGSIIHGGYDLSNVINPPTVNFLSLANFPNQVDPRGLLTFCISGLALLALSYMEYYGKKINRKFSYLSATLGIFSIALYMSRLILLDSSNKIIVILALITGIILLPLWYGLLATEFKRMKLKDE